MTGCLSFFVCLLPPAPAVCLLLSGAARARLLSCPAPVEENFSTDVVQDETSSALPRLLLRRRGLRRSLHALLPRAHSPGRRRCIRAAASHARRALRRLDVRRRRERHR